MRKALPLLLLCGCAALPETAPSPSSASIDRAPVAPLDPGAYAQASLHFKVETYGADRARRISDRAEALYQTIMVDTNLFSFMPSGLYELVIYADRSEYAAKTGQPEWSGGAAYGNAIYSYDGPQLDLVLAHEMTHLVFHEFMARPRRDLLWVDEGLAVYEESKAAGRGMPVGQPIPMTEMLAFVPMEHGTDSSMVGLWYAQAGSMVRYLVERGGTLGFYQFLQALKNGQDRDAAIRSSYGARWGTFSGFYEDWKRNGI
ncbi:MAG: hypothetical protein WC728_18020 [Elusimicrobiota bacterium]